MLLAIDIGNTSIMIGVFDGEKLKATYRLGTNIHRSADDYAALLLNLLHIKGINPSQVSDAILCSVSPPLEDTFSQLCQQYLGITPMQVVAGQKTGVRIRIDNPRELGADRLVNAVAVHYLYCGHIIVIDFGTATTFDVISKEGDYLGGAIAPSIDISLETLFLHTAKLPRVELIRPKQVIGKNTDEAMQSGIIFGYVGLVEGLIARLRTELVGHAKTVATGSFAHVIVPYTSVIENVNPYLTLIGLRRIYEINANDGYTIKHPPELKTPLTLKHAFRENNKKKSQK